MAVTTSAEKVEKVVRPPKNPVTVSNRHWGDNVGNVKNTAIAIPIKYAPKMFATNVPGGSCGKVEFSRFAKYQRTSAPSDAPIAMATMDNTMDWFP
jgi:hypothetical protein